MKKVILLIAGILLTGILLAQAPQLLNYQAVARGISGSILPSQIVSVRFSIHDSTSGGTVIYSETHSRMTNQFGLFTAEIGGGTVLSGTFSAITWSFGNKYMEVEIDLGAGYVTMGTSQLLSVPYALFAASGNQGPPGLLPNGNVAGNTPFWNGSNWIVNNSNIYNNGSDVGIGITPAVSKLEVYKDFPSNNTVENMLTITRTSSGSVSNGIGSSLVFRNEVSNLAVGDNASIDALWEDPTVGNLSSGLNFRLWNLASTNSVMYLRSNGRVGIGTTAPASSMHIFTKHDGDGIFMQPATSNSLGLLMFNTVDLVATLGVAASPGNWIANSVANDVVLKNSRPNALIFATNEIEGMRIDAGGNVGIGITSPSEKLVVYTATASNSVLSRSGSNTSYGAFEARNSANNYFTLFKHGTNAGSTIYGINANDLARLSTNTHGMLIDAADTIYFGTAFSERMRINAVGNVGIGTTAPASRLHLSYPSGVGNGFKMNNSNDADEWEIYVYSSNNLSLFFNGAAMGAFDDVTGTYSAISDERLKEDISESTDLLGKIKQLRLKEYRFKNETQKNKKHLGFLTQDIIKVFPDLVKYQDESDVYMLDYSAFGPIAIKAIQEQQNQIEKQNDEIAWLKNEIAKLKKN